MKAADLLLRLQHVPPGGDIVIKGQEIVGLKVMAAVNAAPRIELLTAATAWPAACCNYPHCGCPFDHPGTEGWCAQGRPAA